MSESIRMWFEIIFTLSYLIVLWMLVFAMKKRMGEVQPMHSEAWMRILRYLDRLWA